MMSTFGDHRKLRLNRVMNTIGFEYANYTKPMPNTEVGEKRKRSTKVSGKKTSKKDKQAGATNDEMKDDETEGDK